MPDNDYTIIKPVEGLQNVGSLTPVTQRKQRKRRQNRQDQAEHPPEEPIDEQTGGESVESEPDEHSIDYCA